MERMRYRHGMKYRELNGCTNEERKRGRVKKKERRREKETGRERERERGKRKGVRERCVEGGMLLKHGYYCRQNASSTG